MQTFKVLIEENAFGAVRPMELPADAPVSALVPALVEELNLPKTDLFGNRLVYMLRHASGGHILADDKSLAASGIAPNTKLALDSFVMSGSVATLVSNESTRSNSSLYSDTTLSDIESLPVLSKDTSDSFPVVKKKRRWTRRAFLVLSGAALGVGSLGLGYAAYRSLMSGHVTTTTHPVPIHPGPPKPALPTSAKPVLSFLQHQQTVRSVSWSTDGKMLASGADDAQLLIWDVGGNVHTKSQQASAVRAVAWSPDGQQVVVGAANQVTFLNPLSGAAINRGPTAVHHTAQVTTVAWAPQQPSRVVSGALDQRAIVWDATTHQPQTIFTHHAAPIESASWASDGQTIGTSSHGGVVRVWNASSGQEIHGLFLDAQVPMHTLAFAPAGSQLAVGGDDGIVRLWNGLICQRAGQGQFGGQCQDMPQRLHAHTKPVRAVAWSPDARFLATAGDDGIVAIWYPTQSQTPILTVQHQAPVLALAWSPTGRQVATAEGNTVTIWELQ